MKLPSFLVGRLGDLAFAVVGLILLLGSLLLAYAYHQVGATPQRSDDVVSFVRDFGEKLNQVALLAPDAPAQIEAQYAPYVSRDLLEKWKADPKSAPGHLTSSPWPSGIRVSSVQNVGVGTYIVKASIIEEANVATTTEEVGETPIILGVIRLGISWQIVEYQLRTGS